MQLKRILLSIITLGWSLWKELQSVKDERDMLHESLHQAKDEHIKSETELKLLIDKTMESKKAYESKPARLIPVEYYDFNELEYLRGVSDVYNSKAFRFFVYNLQQDVLAQFVNGGSDKAIELQGIIKGIAFINKMLIDNENALQAILSPQTEDEGDYV